MKTADGYETKKQDDNCFSVVSPGGLTVGYAMRVGSDWNWNGYVIIGNILRRVAMSKVTKDDAVFPILQHWRNQKAA